MRNLTALVRKLTNKLSSLHLQIATAESCTGGLIAGLLTELPGSSNWFDRGFVTYSNLAKEDMLGIKPDLIQLHGAVSEQVAKAMVEGVLQYSAADLALAVTGIAGPAKGDSLKPVGLVCFAWGLRDSTILTTQCHFLGASRTKVRQLSCRRALQGAISLLDQS